MLDAKALVTFAFKLYEEVTQGPSGPSGAGYLTIVRWTALPRLHLLPPPPCPLALLHHARRKSASCWKKCTGS